MKLKLFLFLFSIIAFTALTHSMASLEEDAGDIMEENSIDDLEKRAPVSPNVDAVNVLEKRYVCGDVCYYGHVRYSYKGLAPCYPNCGCYCGKCRCRHGVCKCKKSSY